MSFRPSSLAFAILGMLAAAFVASLLDARALVDTRTAEVEAMRTLAGRLGLTDIALFSEARYSRHPSQADLHSAFQDHPVALEHFPSGSLIPPRHENLVRETTTPD